MKEPAAPAIEALRERRVRFHPESQHRFAIASLEEIPDWCLSRQLWWGHQIPIWTTPSGEVICAATEEEAQERAGAGVELTRDPDVLDTWFSSALWPFATLGWPEQTPELEAYYPGNVNSTAREIIRLWENRMIWAGLELMGEVPFTDVIIHSTVLAADGRRMSKSLGTGVDPLEMIDAHGADATRYGLLEDLVDAGRALLARRDRGGPQAREQALERLAADPPERGGNRAGRRPDRARGALDPGPDRSRARAGRGGVGGVRLRDRDERALPPHLRRLLRLVRRGGQAAALRARARAPARRRSRRSSACSRSSTR